MRQQEPGSDLELMELSMAGGCLAEDSKALLRRFAALTRTEFELIFELDDALRFRFANISFLPLLGHPPQCLLGSVFSEFAHPDECRALCEELRSHLSGATSGRVLFRFRDGKGNWRWLETSARGYLTASGEPRIVCISRDTTDRQQLEEQRAILSARDGMTLLFNKQYFVKALIQTINAMEAGSIGAVIYVDLDNFKLINDRCGHLAGDRLIVAIANTLHQATPAGGLLARFGGDEFLILLKTVNRIEEATACARNICDCIAQHTFLDTGTEYPLSASVGVVELSASSHSRQVLNQANAACSTAKSLGGNRVELFSPGHSVLWPA